MLTELTRRRVNRQSITSNVANDVTTEQQCKGFGSVKKVKIGRTKPMNVSFKCIPKDIDISCSKSFGISSEWYSQLFCLPMSGTIRLDPRVAEHQPQYEDFKQQNERADTNVKSCEVEQCTISANVKSCEVEQCTISANVKS